MTKVLARYITKGEPYVRVRLTDGRITREHRWVMEQHLGRRLETSEAVHHKDDNKRNNRLANLELKSTSDHSRDHRPTAATVELTCPSCGGRFIRTERYVRSKNSQKQRRFFCGRSCRLPVDTTKGSVV